MGSAKHKKGVLFIQSQAGFGADALIHANIMRNLDRERFDVHVACTAGDGAGAPRSLQVLRGLPEVSVRPTHMAPGLKGHTVPAIFRSLVGAGNFPQDFRDLCRYVKTNRIRLLHSGDHPRDCLYATLLGKLTSAQSIVHVHVKWAEHYSRLARWAVQNSDAVIGISAYVSGTVVGLGRPAADVHTVLNGIEPAGWDPGLEGTAIRQELGVPPGAPLIASVSRLFSWKGQRELLRAFALVKKTLPELRLLIVGADERMVHQTGSFSDELKQLATELGVRQDVVFTGQRSDVARIMAACDVFTLPSFEEPFGLVFLEAMAMQKPVVALNNGGTPEVVEHGKSGLLSAPADISELAKNIVTLLQNPELRAQMGAYGRRRVLDYFNARRMAADTADVYERVLSARE
jgi:glycosyltransferase involved in cell wall biosynthesis